ncbi:helix-turn-helix domain-containing protein [Nocardia sp. alder85J]|uniref:helix-turn-helix domain-containing protein n=1 Tax=Nocardia sp. alder85J TaxID=2862949 RepID=UPI001CD4D8C6|nr:helix-turn-helix transcriptional regulator [Nocardia sp. alder85J]MCX4098263.1 helix-turn-helix transcriptional regulator [Nocardia sp. alder85J]
MIDAPTSLWILAEILDADRAAVRAAIGELTAAKLVAYSQFRHRDVRDAVLRETPITLRRRLHQRIAEVLYECSAPATQVADHLIGGAEVRVPWAVSVLRNAARHAIADDDVPSAIEYLELACRAADNDADRGSMLVHLAVIRWRLSPSTSTRSFARLVNMVHSGAMPASGLAMAARYLLYSGRTEDATRAVRLLDDAATTGEPLAVANRAMFQQWLRCLYPGLATAAAAEPDLRGGGPDQDRTLRRCGWYESDGVAVTLLSDIFTHGACDHSIARAQRLLRAHRLDDRTVCSLLTALDALVYSDRLESAASWCDSLMLEANARQAPAWQAIFGIWRSAMYLRAGAVDDAIGHAVTALSRVRGDGLGTYGGLAVACLVEAATAAGRLREAASYLETEVPETVSMARVGLHYLHARGRYRLAVGELDGARADFLTCGERMRNWHMDIPGLVAWRNDLAEVQLAAGDLPGARRWAAEHLAMIRSAAKHSSGSVSLRLIAATSAPPQRVGLLRKSVHIAASGAQLLDTATALADLADAYHVVGERDRARTAARRALRLAEQCGAEPLRRRLAGPRAANLHPVPVQENPRGAVESLSPSELKVARLAADGCRNREIARELHITTSTVEQHLTRVYRKLGVTRRAGLAAALTDETDTPQTEAV